MKSRSMHIQERTTFLHKLQRHIDRCRQDNSLLGLILIRIQRSEEVNSSLGYKIGDLLFMKVAERIMGILRKKDILGRVGDNGFALIVPQLKNVGHAILAANRISDITDEAFEIEGNVLSPDIAMGISLFPEHAQDADAMFRLADTALSVSIETNAAFKICSELPQDKVVSSLIIENELRRALATDEFMLHYQPKIKLSTGLICGAEALARWTNPSRGFVPPNVFIPVAEQTALMLPFTLWTLNSAARQFAGFHRLCADFSIAVNLSASILHDADTVDLVKRIINIWGIEPGQLILEVTESAIMINPENCLKTLRRLHDIGVMLSIDDFGTGYSSLAYVKKLPIQELKIDKSFVMNMDKDKGNAMIVRTVIDMAHNFGIFVTAEGVESRSILDQLIYLGCDCAQGFHMARPMPAEDLHKWICNSPGITRPESKVANG